MNEEAPASAVDTAARRERSCWTCAACRPAPTCRRLRFGDEGDPLHDGICAYCERSGANDADDGMPTDRWVDCPAWVGVSDAR